MNPLPEATSPSPAHPPLLPSARWLIPTSCLLVLLTRLAHTPLVWSEEAYPASAALQMLYGLLPYRDFFYDKPPLAPIFYLLIGAHTGLPLRLLGTFYVLACSLLALLAARALGWRREAAWAFALTAFFFTFDFPSAAIPLTPDLLLVAPHLGVFCLLLLQRPALAGLLAGIGFLIHTKGLFLLLLCLLWRPASCWRILLGFSAPVAASALSLAALGALPSYWRQVWQWGSAYAADSHLSHPLAAGAARIVSWIWFHATLLFGAAAYFLRRPDHRAFKFVLWTLLSLAGIALGWRFFPRYFFQLLPVMVLLGARGLSLLPPRLLALALALLLIPFARFGPRYLTLALSSDAGWADTAMDRDSRAAAALIQSFTQPADSIFIWGYRPDLLLRSRLPLGAPFLDSQPLTGVLADRHLTSSQPTFPALAAQNRRLLTTCRPSFLIDGLALYNPRLAITQFPDLHAWLAHYREIGRTSHSIIYRLSYPPLSTPASSPPSATTSLSARPHAAPAAPARNGSPP